ncbi:MAG: hypothetical protein F6K47_34800, partial [Symploca sp. SIO2E6]|nr:hypothetical protein [Symploca sp. SIO2E6]
YLTEPKEIVHARGTIYEQGTFSAKDISRAWAIAEGNSENRTESIGLQYRYALIFTSFNSLASNILPEFMAALLEKEIWQPAQALAYVRQNKDSKHQAEGLEAIIQYLPPSLSPEALEVAIAIGGEQERVRALVSLAPHLPEVLPEALEAARAIRNEYQRADALARLAPHLPEVLPEALEVARAIGDESNRARALEGLAPHLPEVLPEALEVARAIGDESNRARALEGLASHLPEVLPEALDAARAIGDEYYRAYALRGLIEMFTPSSVDYPLWQKTLHTLASLTRPKFLEALPHLAPFIIHFGGVEALRETVKAVKDVSRWWK